MKYININNENVLVQIIGFNHDVSNGESGITFITKNALKDKYVGNSTNSTAGGWANFTVRSYLNQTIYNNSPELQKIAKEVVKKCEGGGSNKVIMSTVDKLWLLSFEEIGFTNHTSNLNGQGYRYPIFSECKPFGGCDLANRIKSVNNTNSIWWLRSSFYYDSNRIWSIGAGGESGYNPANWDEGIVFAFCI